MREIKFERTVWAEKHLAKLCPNNDIKRMGEIIQSDDFTVQVDAIMNMICIMNEAHERKAHFLDNSYEMHIVTVEELENLSDTELMELSTQAFASFSEDGETTIQTEPKKLEAE